MLGGARWYAGACAAGPGLRIPRSHEPHGYLRRMDIRHCARPGCQSPATATMTYHYASRTVWLDSPGEEPDAAAAWGLCAPHADALKVPVGWACDDRRTPIIPIRPSIAV